MVLCILGCDSGTKKATGLKDKADAIDYTTINRSPVLEDRIFYDTISKSPKVDKQFWEYKYKEGEMLCAEFRKYINSNNIDSLVIVEDDSSIKNISYLGVLETLNKVNSYHVIKVFSILGKGDFTSKGNSKLLFINTSDNKIIHYQCNMPYELPEQIVDNSLLFKNNNEKVYIAIKGGLPSVFCTRITGCYQ